MTTPAARLSRRWLSSIMALAATGCASLLGLSPAPHLYRVTPKNTFPANLPHPSAQLLIDVPLAPAGLDTGRIALSRSAVSIDYFADSEWIDQVPLMVQTALLDSFENSKAITAIDRESIGLRADIILKTDIRHFEALYNSPNGAPEVWVAIGARLVNPRAAMSWQTPRSNGVSKPRATTSPNRPRLRRGAGRRDGGHRSLDCAQSRFVGKAPSAMMDTFRSRGVTWRGRMVENASSSVGPKSSGWKRQRR